MQVDFYHLTRDPAEKLVPMLAEKSLKAVERVLVVSQGEAARAAISAALWKYDPSSFLAHGLAGSDHDAHQPVLISETCDAANGAKYIVLGDGIWREEALDFERAFYLFSAQEISAARTAWRDLSEKKDVTPRYWKQDAGRWIEGP